MTEFVTAYGPKNRVTIEFPEKGRTKQSFAKEANINDIMAKFRKTGLVEHVRETPGEFADLVGQTDFHTAMNIVAEGNSAFAEMPADIRAKFANDPGQFLDFVTNPANAQELVDMGLAKEVNPPNPAPPGAYPPDGPPPEVTAGAESPPEPA